MNISELIKHVESKGISITYLEAMKIVKLSNKRDNQDRTLDDLIFEVVGE